MNSKKNKIIENIIFISNHKDSKLLEYSKYKKAFDFIKKKFLEVKLENLKIYICSKDLFNLLNTNGYGLYCNSLKTIIIKEDVLDVDIILVHELLHYVSNTVNKFCSRNIKNEEDFVLANLIDYLVEKQWKEKDIILFISLNKKCKINEAKEFFKNSINKIIKMEKIRIL